MVVLQAFDGLLLLEFACWHAHKLCPRRLAPLSELEHQEKSPTRYRILIQLRVRRDLAPPRRIRIMPRVSGHRVFSLAVAICLQLSCGRVPSDARVSAV